MVGSAYFFLSLLTRRMIRVPFVPLLKFAYLACAALAVLALVASEARAECGDYVIVRRATPADTSNNFSVRLALQNHIADRSVWRLAASHSDSIPARPCYGPACSNRDSVPFSPTKALVHSVPDWALPAVPVTLATAEPVLLELVRACPVSSHRFEPILRPPRAA
jgi:hypothetical protein